MISLMEEIIVKNVIILISADSLFFQEAILLGDLVEIIMVDLQVNRQD
jgi:hypothetical protein